MDFSNVDNVHFDDDGFIVISLTNGIVMMIDRKIDGIPTVCIITEE